MSNIIKIAAETTILLGRYISKNNLELCSWTCSGYKTTGHIQNCCSSVTRNNIISNKIILDHTRETSGVVMNILPGWMDVSCIQDSGTDLPFGYQIMRNSEIAQPHHD